MEKHTIIFRRRA